MALMGACPGAHPPGREAGGCPDQRAVRRRPPCVQLKLRPSDEPRSEATGMSFSAAHACQAAGVQPVDVSAWFGVAPDGLVKWCAVDEGQRAAAPDRDAFDRRSPFAARHLTAAGEAAYRSRPV